MSKFIQALLAFVTAMWRKGKIFMDRYAEMAVEFVERLQLVLDTPTEAAIAALIPGIKDDKALQFLRERLLKIMLALGIEVPLEDQTDIVKIVKALVVHIAAMPKTSRAGLYRDLASMLALAKAEHENFKHLKSMTRSRVDLAVQLQHLKISDKDDKDENDDTED